MSFPHINTKASNVSITPAIEELLVQKFEPLGRLIDERVESRCEIELEKVAEHQSGRIYRAEVNLWMGGKLFRAEATEDQIEKSIDEARNELRNELSREHGKRQSLWKRGAQTIKDILRFGKE